ncbi:MAG: DsbA family oxidoreductase [Proteobacteria bacterium]|nr:DsbA family oxidoreductase [Pseudomonadota bacterium]MDA1355902.1 DsbA family oxidoreductase [Pseudomonadota bacterium]
MPLKVQVFSDYVCPYCFLAEGPLNEAVAELEGAVEVEWMPFELRPYPTPTLEPEGDYLQSGWRQSIYPMAERMGVRIVLPRVSPQPYTRLAFEGALEARDQGKAAAYNHRMFTAFFQDELDIGNVDVLSDCAAEIGLDREIFRVALDNRLHSQECEQQLSLGRDRLQINSVPTFVIDNRLGIPGLVPKDSLVSVFREQLAAVAE